MHRGRCHVYKPTRSTLPQTVTNTQMTQRDKFPHALLGAASTVKVAVLWPQEDISHNVLKL